MLLQFIIHQLQQRIPIHAAKCIRNGMPGFEPKSLLSHTVLPLNYIPTNMIRAPPLFTIDAIIFSQCDDKSELSGATLCFLPRSKHMQDFTCKFHGSFRCFFLNSLSRKLFVCCHTATLTNFLCYTPISQVQGKSTYLRVPFSP